MHTAPQQGFRYGRNLLGQKKKSLTPYLKLGIKTWFRPRHPTLWNQWNDNAGGKPIKQIILYINKIAGHAINCINRKTGH